MLIKLIDKYDNFIFDLDNTLYDEKIYLFEAYANIAHFLSNESLNSENILNDLKNTFLNEGRANLFNKLFLKYNIKQVEIDNWLFILRNFQTNKKIELFPKMYNLLKELALNKKKIYILTNGNISQQKNKIKNINWHNMLNHIKIYYANNIEPKPSNKSLELIIKLNKLDRDKIIFIGDSKIDEECANRSLVPFMHVNTVKSYI